MTKYIVYRTQKLIQNNHLVVEANSKKEAIEKAEKTFDWENAETTLVSENFTAEKEAI